MPKEYNNLWVFGDSYTTPNVCVEPKDSFWGLLAEYCKIKTVKNCSRIVNSFDSICQLVVSEQSNIDWTNDLIVIGVPPLERVTVFDDFKDTHYYGHEFNTTTWEGTEFLIPGHHSLVALQNYGGDKELISHSNRSWTETQALRNIFLLTKWLDAEQANYMIVNLSRPLSEDNTWMPSKALLPYASNHPRCILFSKTYHSINKDRYYPEDYSQYGEWGHHGPLGNKCFFEESLLPQMIKCNLV